MELNNKNYLQIKDTELEWLSEAVVEIKEYPNADSAAQDSEDVSEGLDYLYVLAKAFDDKPILQLVDKVGHLIKSSKLSEAINDLDNAESGKTQILTGQYQC